MKSVKTSQKSKPRREHIINALKNLAVRFPHEFQSTTKICKCMQFEDQLECRHTLALQVLEREEKAAR